jgi:hypothetical protein
VRRDIYNRPRKLEQWKIEQKMNYVLPILLICLN